MPSKGSKQRIRPGDVMEIPLPDGSLGYARVLPSPIFGFLAVRRRPGDPVPDVSDAPYAFKIWVHESGAREGRWQVIGHGLLSDSDKETPYFIHQDALSRRVRRYKDGQILPDAASKSDVEHLEPAAVWEVEQAEERLLDFFEERENRHLRSMRDRALQALG